MSRFGRWPWSWPVDVPCRVQLDDGAVATLRRKGVIYDMIANVGHGYEGEVRKPGGFVLGYKVGRSYLRGKLRVGEWRVIP